LACAHQQLGDVPGAASADGDAQTSSHVSPLLHFHIFSNQNIQFKSQVRAHFDGQFIFFFMAIPYQMHVHFQVLIFMGSWMPLTIVNLLRDIGVKFLETQMYFKLLNVHAIAMTSVVSNPLLYFWMSKVCGACGKPNIYTF
jgi:hypothetical protein